MEPAFPVYTTQWASPLGALTLACDREGLCGLWLAGQKYFARGMPPMAPDPSRPALIQAQAWLASYFAGERPSLEQLPLAPRGSAFQKQVWRLLCAIPYGETRSYGHIAREMAALLGRDSMSAQAVGGAVGRNPISILIPCHRVVGSNGSLTGYAGGIDKKRWLLEWERRAL